MSLTLIEPPAFRDLLKDAELKRYILRTPRLPGSMPTPNPYRVWGIRHDEKWAGKLFQDYRDAFDLVKTMLKQTDKYADVVITCRPVAFGPPAGYDMPKGMQWCGHCRRPSVFRRMYAHPVMKKWPVISDDEVMRCFYCAARQQRFWHW